MKSILSYISDFFDSCISKSRTLTENMNNLKREAGKLTLGRTVYGSTKLDILIEHLYDETLHGDRPDILRKQEKMRKAYYKIVGPAYDLVNNNKYSENFDAQKIAKIIVDILYLKKDELDKIDGGLPVV